MRGGLTAVRPGRRRDVPPRSPVPRVGVWPGSTALARRFGGENSCLVRRVADAKKVFYIADWSDELGRMGVRAGLVVRWWRVSGLRLIAGPFVAAAPAGARVRARLRVSPQDEAVLRAAGNYLGSLAGADLAARCAEGRLDPKGRAVSRAARKRALTAR